MASHPGSLGTCYRSRSNSARAVAETGTKRVPKQANLTSRNCTQFHEIPANPQVLNALEATHNRRVQNPKVVVERRSSTLTEPEHDGRRARPPVLVAFRSRRRRTPRDRFEGIVSAVSTPEGEYDRQHRGCRGRRETDPGWRFHGPSDARTASPFAPTATKSGTVPAAPRSARQRTPAPPTPAADLASAR
jgi:hypothetical protein